MCGSSENRPHPINYKDFIEVLLVVIVEGRCMSLQGLDWFDVNSHHRCPTNQLISMQHHLQGVPSQF